MGETETRTRILEAARRLFHEQGYAATGVSTILREAGAGSGSLYHFFSSKEALLAAVLETYPNLLAPVLTDPVERETSDPLARVFGLLEAYRAGLVATGCQLGCPIGNLALEVSDEHPQVRPLIERNFQAWIDTVGGWLRDPAARLPEGTDTEALARHVLAVMEGAIMQARAAGDLAPFDTCIRELRRYFGLLTKGA